MDPSNFVKMIDWPALVPILVAVVLGGLTGLEREIHRKSAGLRTMILISTGAALFTVIANRMVDESGAMRIVQGVITGVGFIGAGAIIRDRASVHGITTAAMIWLMTGIGVACGMRMYELAVGVTVIALVTVWGLGPLDRKITHQPHNRRTTDQPESDN